LTTYLGNQNITTIFFADTEYGIEM